MANIPASRRIRSQGRLELAGEEGLRQTSVRLQECIEQPVRLAILQHVEEYASTLPLSRLLISDIV